MSQLPENFDVIIATYNRPQRVISLVKQINKCYSTPNNIIVVDSSDEDNIEVSKLSNVMYAHSSHKNQPYQRLLGAKLSGSTYVVYLDDDLTITDYNIFNYILKQYHDENVVGVTVGIEYHNSISNKIDGPIIKTNNKLVKLFWKFTGVPYPSRGKIGRFGVPGKLPIEIENVQYFYGPVMSFKKDIVNSLIGVDLLALYERKIGKGEDKVISMKANNYGKLIIDPKICLLHPAVESAYFDDVYSFYRKLIYSRLYLNKTYKQVFRKFEFPTNLDYYWFSGWRFGISLFSWLMSSSDINRNKMNGVFSGIALSIKRPQKATFLTPELDWEKEIQFDCEHAIINDEDN